MKYEEMVVERVARMMAEIREDMVLGVVPMTCKSFEELHDYVDANCYGNFCDDAEAERLIKLFGGLDEHESMPAGMVQFISDCQDAIATWLRVSMADRARRPEGEG